MFLTSKQVRDRYNNGDILENRNNQQYVYIFQLCNMHFSSTARRAKKGKQYQLNDTYWKIHSTSLFKKLQMIFNRQVHLIKRKG